MAIRVIRLYIQGFQKRSNYAIYILVIFIQLNNQFVQHSLFLDCPQAINKSAILGPPYAIINLGVLILENFEFDGNIVIFYIPIASRRMKI